MPLKEIKYEAALRFSDDADNNQQIAGEAEHRGNDDSAGREDVGIEGLFRAAWACHQQVSDANQDAGRNQNAATGQNNA